MFYGMECMDACGVGLEGLGFEGLGQLHPEGLDCAEVKRLYEREKRLSKTRSKASHRKRHKANAERFQLAYDECQVQKLPAHRIPEAAGGQPELVSALTPTGVEQLLVAQSRPVVGPSFDYSRVGMLAFGGAIVIGGLIYLMRPKKGTP